MILKPRRLIPSGNEIRVIQVVRAVKAIRTRTRVKATKGTTTRARTTRGSAIIAVQLGILLRIVRRGKGRMVNAFSAVRLDISVRIARRSKGKARVRLSVLDLQEGKFMLSIPLQFPIEVVFLLRALYIFLIFQFVPCLILVHHIALFHLILLIVCTLVLA